MKQKFDLIIPLGHACVCTDILRRNNLQYFSYPLDWVRTVSLEHAVTLLSDKFTPFLESPEELELLNTSEPGKKHYRNTRSDILFLHDFPDTIPLAEKFPQVKDKYARRINRLYQDINNSRSILFVNTAEACKEIPDVSDEYYLCQYQRLSRLFPDKEIHLACCVMTHVYNPDTFYQIKKLSPQLIRFDCFSKEEHPQDIWAGHHAALMAAAANFKLNSRLKLKSLGTKHGLSLFWKKTTVSIIRKTGKIPFRLAAAFIFDSAKRKAFRKKYTEKINRRFDNILD